MSLAPESISSFPLNIYIYSKLASTPLIEQLTNMRLSLGKNQPVTVHTDITNHCCQPISLPLQTDPSLRYSHKTRTSLLTHFLSISHNNYNYGYIESTVRHPVTIYFVVDNDSVPTGLAKCSNCYKWHHYILKKCTNFATSTEKRSNSAEYTIKLYTDDHNFLNCWQYNIGN